MSAFQEVLADDVTIYVGTARSAHRVSRSLLKDSAYFCALLSGRWGKEGGLTSPSHGATEEKECCSANISRSGGATASLDCDENTFELLAAFLRYKDIQSLPPLSPWDVFRLQRELDYLGVNFDGRPSSELLLKPLEGAYLPPDLNDPTLLVKLPRA
eukprot:jgi/Mesen1/266/ME1145557C09452